MYEATFRKSPMPLPMGICRMSTMPVDTRSPSSLLLQRRVEERVAALDTQQDRAGAACLGHLRGRRILDAVGLDDDVADLEPLAVGDRAGGDLRHDRHDAGTETHLRSLLGRQVPDDQAEALVRLLLLGGRRLDGRLGS